VTERTVFLSKKGLEQSVRLWKRKRMARVTEGQLEAGMKF
jgi:hypothetical protein